MVCNKKPALEIYMQPTIFSGDFVETKRRTPFFEISGYLKNELLKTVQSLAESFYDTFEMIEPDRKRPNTARVEFGLQIDVNGQVFIAQASANSGIKFTFEWTSATEK